MKRARVSDVSRLAGVSTATVSRVLNAPERVAEATRNRVFQAIDELNFIKSATGLSLKTQQSGNVMVVVGNVGNIFFSEIFEGLCRRAEANAYNLMITSAETDGGHDVVIERLRNGRVDGVVILDGYTLGDEDYDRMVELYQGTPPIVGFGEKPGYLRYPHVYIDNRAAARTATRHLIAAGHKRIGHTLGPAGSPATEQRLLGFRDAMKEAGLAVREQDIFSCGFRQQGGREVARLLAAGSERPTALFCANDESAMGLMSELGSRGISVPDDISIIGFDDIVLADCYSPPLTTMCQPRTEIGATAMDLLLQLLHAQRTGCPPAVELEVSLIERMSVSTPPGQRRLSSLIDPRRGTAYKRTSAQRSIRD